MTPRDDRAWPGLTAGVLVSLLAHAGFAWWLVAAAAAATPGPHAPPPPPDAPAPDRPDQIELGSPESTTASITWLGVLEEPEEANAPLGQTDQAALTTTPGPEAPPTPDTPAPPTQQPQPVAQPQPEIQPEAQPQLQTESQPTPEQPPEQPPESASPTPDPAQPEPLPDPQPDPAPAQTTPDLPADPPPGPSLIAEPTPRDDAPATEPEPAAQPEPAEPTEPEQSQQPPTTQPDQPTGIMGPPIPENLEQPTPPTNPATPAPPTADRPSTPTGDRAVISDREADALRRTALEYEVDGLNRPISGKGLEIKTVRPEWPVLVRQSYNPRNPVVVIRFGPDGKVKKAEFLRERDGSKGSGYEPVDGPIVDAVYRWTARGTPIDNLDKTDPDAEVVVSIRIILVSRRPVP